MKSILRNSIIATLLPMLITASLLAAENNKDGKEGKASTGIVEGRDTKGLTIELISSVTSIAPGQPFEVGLKIKHDPHFHTYWKNPGVVGVPIGFDWTLPDGFKASEVHWPYPELSKMADYACYGYERDVLVTVTITPPNKIAPATKSVTLKTDCNWMCCSDVCFPGFKTFALTLPVGTQIIDPVHENAFAQALHEQPRKKHHFSAKLLSNPNAKEIKIELTGKEPFTPIHLFNSDGQTTPDLKSSLTKKSPTHWTYTTPRSEHGPESSKNFPFILQTKTSYYNLTAQ